MEIHVAILTYFMSLFSKLYVGEEEVIAAVSSFYDIL